MHAPREIGITSTRGMPAGAILEGKLVLHSPGIIANTLVRTFAIGISAGMRSQMPGAVLTQALRSGNLGRGRGPVWSALRRPVSSRIALAMAGGELVGDKLPFVPSRIEGAAGLARLVTGATMGALLASGLGARSGGLAFAAVSGAAGAAVGSYGGYFARKGVTEQYGLPDLSVALVEDLGAFTIARLAVAKQL